ncbi:MAG: hypothetical protein WD295_05845 [Bacteroidota bacterium]
MIRHFSFAAALCVLVFLAGCSAATRLQSSLGDKYRYKYRLTYPIESQTLRYRDDRLGIAFLIDDSAIRFLVQNLSTVTMYVRWENASVGIKGRYYSVRNTRTLYLPTASTVVSPAIPPRGYVIDMALPAENISFEKGEWKETDLLPTTDRNSARRKQAIQKNVGSNLVLILLVDFGGELRRYTFQFTVASVDPLPWNRYRKPRRPAAPAPSTEPAVSSGSTPLTVALVAGLLGFTAFMVSREKTPVKE